MPKWSKKNHGIAGGEEKKPDFRGTKKKGRDRKRKKKKGKGDQG